VRLHPGRDRAKDARREERRWTGGGA
jgi:hypothetical protein